MVASGSHTTGVAGAGGKYTQGYVFHHDTETNEQIKRVVERSCFAVSTLLQSVFSAVERQIVEDSQRQAKEDALQVDTAGLRAVVRGRQLLERGVLSAVSCSFISLADEVQGEHNNDAIVEQSLEYFQMHRLVSYDLWDLFELDQMVSLVNNNNRPLLVHLAAQYSALMGDHVTHVQCCPLSPTVLTGGFVAALLCIDSDLVTKRMLIDAFEKEFLSRLSVLLNSITLRLEEEGVQVGAAVSFDEKEMGPIREFLETGSQVKCEEIIEEIKELQKNAPDDSDVVPDFKKQEASKENVIELLSAIYASREKVAATMVRDMMHRDEVATLNESREYVASYLNKTLKSTLLPETVLRFIADYWVSVLFDVKVLQGSESEQWRELDQLLSRLLASITPHETEEQRAELIKAVPELVKRLRELIELSGYSHSECASFFEELKALHLQNFQQKLSTDGWSEWVELSVAESTVPVDDIVSQESRDYLSGLTELVA